MVGAGYLTFVYDVGEKSKMNKFKLSDTVSSNKEGRNADFG